MSRPFIIVGDKTSHGGTVVSGATTATTHSKQIARVGDKVTCPRCGSTTIATGDNTMIIMGKPVARDGDKTACGATLISSQSVTVVNYGAASGAGASNPASFADMFFAGDSNDSAGQAASSDVAASSVAASAGPEKRTEYHYRPIVEQAYHISQVAQLPVEGIGINGSYAIDGYITLQGNALTVSAMGRTAAAQRGKVHFDGDIVVTRGGLTIAEQKFAITEPSTWPDDVIPLGTAIAQLPTPTSAESAKLAITCRYVYTSYVGSATPAPPSTQDTYPLYVDPNS